VHRGMCGEHGAQDSGIVHGLPGRSAGNVSDWWIHSRVAL